MDKKSFPAFFSLLIFSIVLIIVSENASGENWKHLSSVNGDIDVPNPGKQQTATAVLDVDKDGVNDFFITERSEAPSVVWYRRTSDGWKRYVIDDTKQRIEAGSASYDIDGDGDTDIVFGGDGGSNCVWWWENPYPNYDPNVPWKRYEIKNSGKNKHHDQMFGDFDGDGQIELVFWNQGEKKLYIADIPKNPKSAATWDYKEIYAWSGDSQMEQRGTYPGWKGTNEHEGLAKIDIDGDGKLDIIGGGHWFKHIEGDRFLPNVIDTGYVFTRTAAGQLVEGGRPEVVLVVGDGIAPLIMYEWKDGTWMGKVIWEGVNNGHSIDIIDFDGDGHLDIFNAEMNLGDNPDAKTRIFLGDGTGNFRLYVPVTGFGLHESQITDLDGDGDYDILGKPYKWEAPRLDIWINEGK
ncbi:MAG: VCBS repeat-containing protein [Candidatus Latescibacteria bacterium]|nr:VCBS repeat-containing protein [Candidatus Latescibacterota bacterium]